MKTNLAAVAIFLLAGTSALAHRLDEYLQGTILSVEKDRVEAQITLTPGIAVFPTVLADIDTDADGVITEPEQRAYAERVLRDLKLTIDGHTLKPRLLSVQFPAIEEMKDGQGEIRIELKADLPLGGSARTLIFENHHQNSIAAYQVNCLVPRDPDVRIVSQNRNYTQSFYQLDYVQAGARSGPLSLASWSRVGKWLGTVSLVVFAWLAILWRRTIA